MILRIAKRVSAFVQIDRRALRDVRLSFKARGLLAYLLSMADNWSVNSDHLSDQGPDGRTAILSALKELEDTGYLQRTKKRTDEGHFTWESVVYECPPESGFPMSDDPMSDNPTSKVYIGKLDANKVEEDSSPDGETTVGSLIDHVLNQRLQATLGQRSLDLLEDVFLPAWDDVQEQGTVNDAVALTIRYLEKVLGGALDTKERSMVAMTVRNNGKVALYAWAKALGATENDDPRSRLAYARAVINRTMADMRESA